MGAGDRIRQMAGEASSAEESVAEKASGLPRGEGFEKRANKAGEFIYDWIGSLDPLWGERLEIMRAERGLSKLQAVGACISYVLDTAQHMAIPNNPAFEGQLSPPGEKTCPACEVVYVPRYPGCPFCSDRCAESWRARDAEMAAVEGRPARLFPDAA